MLGMQSDSNQSWSLSTHSSYGFQWGLAGYLVQHPWDPAYQCNALAHAIAGKMTFPHMSALLHPIAWDKNYREVRPGYQFRPYFSMSDIYATMLSYQGQPQWSPFLSRTYADYQTSLATMSSIEPIFSQGVGYGYVQVKLPFWLTIANIHRVSLLAWVRRLLLECRWFPGRLNDSLQRNRQVRCTWQL